MTHINLGETLKRIIRDNGSFLSKDEAIDCYLELMEVIEGLDNYKRCYKKLVKQNKELRKKNE